MNKKDLIAQVSISPATISKMTKGEFVSMEVLYRIGQKLDVDFADMVEIVRDKERN